MYIQLTPEAYDHLLDHVAPDSTAYQCLSAAVKFTGTSGKPDWYTVNCDLEAAQILLGVARRHRLSAAVKNLEHGIRELKHRVPKG